MTRTNPVRLARFLCLVAIAFWGCFGTPKGLYTTARPAAVQSSLPWVELPRAAPPPPEVTERARANPPRIVPQLGTPVP